MKEARHIATGRIVLASEADYAEYNGIFECPHCKVPLRLRKEYTTRSGKTITAAFTHPQGETDMEKNCPYRIDMNFNNTESQIKFPESKEQCYKLLKKNFLKCLKNYSEVTLTGHYPANQSALECIRIFLDLNNKIIQQEQNSKYILQLPELQKETIEKRFQNKVRADLDSYKRRPEVYKKALADLEYDLNIATRKSNSLIWGLEFLIHEADKVFVEKTLDFIFGKYVANKKLKGIIGYERKSEIFYNGKIFYNRKIERIARILGFELSIIKRANLLLSDNKLIDQFFIEMYKKEFSGSNGVIFNEITKIHNAVFKHIINYLVYFPWESLSNYKR
ncbi:hypothetical protein [Nostoc sp. 'Peltigera membranacea cyanobiont' N6]|uniref:hypothetical protein n=1 Tax=Nostoc sp. 'Peltigera membranacea cyanobiont' N6 TaxID=1261031 RepID=UPI000CF31B4D|nr:hypothetical protein [Nostoc sp. 'Peltigera membranacea cyanobiont' N6]AVH68444.1 hypothetical protein NPM_30032 [Nostoc sp. 'Peltigera membranacea cyanobiont' N6]